MSKDGNTPKESQAPTWLWWSTVSLLATVLAVGLGLVAAFLLGWRTPTPRRAPDWTFDDLIWTQHGDGVAAITNEGYQIRLAQPDQRAWAVADQPVTDFDVEVVVRSAVPSEDVGYGLLYRYQDRANYYLFAIGGDGYYTIAVVHKGELTPLQVWQQWPHVRRGAATNRLRVRCEETRCRFHINDEFTTEIENDLFLAGHLGLWAETFSDDGLGVVFGRVRLWSIK